MEGLAVLLGLGALFCTVVLPILTYAAVRALRERMEMLARPAAKAPPAFAARESRPAPAGLFAG